MRRIALLFLLISGFAAQAETWERLDGAGIVAALQGAVIDYDGAWQDFRASGRTLYNAGADSWGYWQVQDDQYCSQWPPNALWACYDVDRDGRRIRFIGAFDDISVGALRE